MTDVMPLPPLPAVGTIGVEIFGPDSGSAKWDVALWDEDVWASLGWRDVTPESVNVEMTWGADDPSGVLTVPAAGGWTITTYDPERKLDPSNGASEFGASLRPGRPIRLTYIDPETAAITIVHTGLIDEIKYNIKEQTGSMTGTDGISLMANAKLPPDQHLDVNMPKTLRARTAYLLKKAGLQNLIKSEIATDFKSYALTTVPLHYWRMGGAVGSGMMKDIGSQPFNGGNTLTAAVGGLVAVDDKATLYNGTGALSYVPGSGGIIPWNVGWTAGCALQVPSVITNEQIIMTWPHAGTMALRITTALNVRVYEYGTNAIKYTSIATVNPDAINTVYISQTDTEIILYINGVEERTGVPPFVIAIPNNQPFRIGGNGNLAENFIVDEFLMWNRSLSDTEIKNFHDLAMGTIGSYDPPVGPMVENEASVWSHIMNAAYDALYAVWIDKEATLRFRSFGNPRDNGFAVGKDAIPISNIEVQAGLANVYTHIVAYDELSPDVPVIAYDHSKSAIYGDISLRRQSPVPNARLWADSVLADRSGAALQYVPGTIYPQTSEDLYALLDLGMIDIMHIRATDTVLPTIDVNARVLGAKITADTGTGWTVQVSSYIPGSEWDEAETIPPVIPPVIPPGTVTQIVTRYYNCTKSTAVARTSGGSYYGAGKDGELPIGAWQGWRYRTFLDFDDIPWSKVVSVEKCELLINVTTQVQVGFGSAPKVVIKRVTESWSEGGASGQAYNNATIYPGPSCTSTGSVSRGVTRTENAGDTLALTEIARAWFNGSKQMGIGLFSAGEDNTKYTTEIWPHENSTEDKRPKLKLTLKVTV
jgi:hypothetical protein